MKIAVIGSGVSGLVAAYLLSRDHDIRVFEASDYVGGHTNTITVREESREIPVDTGFIVYNPAHYPNFCRLIEKLGVAGQKSDMSFSVRCDRTGLEYNGASLNKVFAQRRNLIRPRFLRMLRDILKFNRDARGLLAEAAIPNLNVGDYVSKKGYSREFLEHYLVPLGCSLWSTPAETFTQFPIQFVVEFLDNHCMLQVENRPAWHVIEGGSRQYVLKLLAGFRGQITLNCPVLKVRRRKRGAEVKHSDGVESFDEVVVATHADQALRLLEHPDSEELDLLGTFPYQENEAILHTDCSILPRNQRAWASWNCRIPRQKVDSVKVTYNMNLLQGLDSKQTYCVSLNESERISPQKIIRRIRYTHPVFQEGRSTSQLRHQELIRRRGISYCGAYWGFGFHEDGVRSALKVCEAFGRSLD
jgi:predicted NAD/FAD-binding protein